MNKFEGPRPQLDAPKQELGTKKAVQESLEAVEGQNSKLEFYSPETLGLGMENAVFSLEKTFTGDHSENLEVKRHRNVVAKIDLRSIEKTLKDNQKNDKPPGHLSEARREKIMGDIESSKARFAQLREYFPRYVVPERYYIEPVPVNKALLESATNRPERAETLTEKIVEVPAMVRLQVTVAQEVLVSPDTMDLGGDYRERDKRVKPEEYVAWNKDLVEGEGSTAEDYLRRIDKTEAGAFNRLLDQMKIDPELQQVIRDFAEQAMAYTTDTKEMLDIFGKNNIITHKDKRTGKWTMTFMDALYPAKQAWEKALDSVNDIVSKQDLTTADTSAAINTLNYVRNLNALAAVTGSDQRLRLPTSLSAKNLEIFSKARKTYLGETSGDSADGPVTIGSEDLEAVELPEDELKTILMDSDKSSGP